MIRRTLRIATRQSPLALWQANHIRVLLMKRWPMLTIDLLPMITSGDKFLKDKLLAAGGKGLFVKELEDALLDNRADIAVHSTKDMPAELPPGLNLGAICERDNPFDAFISYRFPNLNSLPQKAIVGTASLRRQSQLLSYRPDLHIKTLRGNINTRLAKLKAGEFDAIILAAAGLERMGMQDNITELLSEDIMLPSCAQGALCIESRIADLEVQELIAPLNDPISALCVRTERHVNAQLGGNCHTPLAVFCSVTAPGQLHLRAKILNSDGSQLIANSQKGLFEQALQLANQCSAALFEQGAEALIHSASP
jgi:hydroxymethylbilane synthase